MSQKNLFIVAVLVDLILLAGFIAILGLTIGTLDQEPVVITAETPTLIPVPTDTITPTPMATNTPTFTPTPTESPTLTPIPSPTRILPEEPTKVPYVFQTPVYIPPNMRDQPTRTPTRTRTR